MKFLSGSIFLGLRAVNIQVQLDLATGGSRNMTDQNSPEEGAAAITSPYSLHFLCVCLCIGGGRGESVGLFFFFSFFFFFFLMCE